MHAYYKIKTQQNPGFAKDGQSTLKEPYQYFLDYSNFNYSRALDFASKNLSSYSDLPFDPREFDADNLEDDQKHTIVMAFAYKKLASILQDQYSNLGFNNSRCEVPHELLDVGIPLFGASIHDVTKKNSG